MSVLTSRATLVEVVVVGGVCQWSFCSMYIPFSNFPVKIVCWSSFLVVQMFRSKIVLWPAAARRETERRDTRKVGTYRAWIRMFLSFIGPPFDDITVLPSPSFMFMACGKLERERKTCLRLNMWCEAPESITVREVDRGDDRRAKDSSIREDSRVCASVSQRGGSLWLVPVVSDSSARFALAVFFWSK